MKYVLIIVGCILFIVVVITIIGFLLPVNHTSTIRVSLNTTPEKVWQKLQNFSEYPQWRKNVKSVDARSLNSWVETDGRNHRLPLEIVSQDAPKTMGIKINGKGLPFGGAWIFTLAAEGPKTIVDITENGEVYNPFFRFISRYIMGYDGSIRQYASDLTTFFNH